MKTLFILLLSSTVALAQPPAPPTNSVARPTPQQLAKLKAQQTNSVTVQPVIHLATFSYYALQPIWQNIKCFVIVEGSTDMVSWVDLYKGPADNCYHNYQFNPKYKYHRVVYAPIL